MTNRRPVIFISFGEEDRDAATEVREKLREYKERTGNDWEVYKFDDPESKFVGNDIEDQIQRRIQGNEVRCVLFVLSEKSIRRPTSILNEEITAAIKKSRKCAHRFAFAVSVSRESALSLEIRGGLVSLVGAFAPSISDLDSIFKQIADDLKKFPEQTTPLDQVGNSFRSAMPAREMEISDSPLKQLAPQSLSMDEPWSFVISPESKSLLSAFLHSASSNEFFSTCVPEFVVVFLGRRQEHSIPFNLDKYMRVESDSIVDLSGVSEALCRRWLRSLKVEKSVIYMTDLETGVSPTFSTGSLIDTDPRSRVSFIEVVDNVDGRVVTTCRVIDSFLTKIEKSKAKDTWRDLICVPNDVLFLEASTLQVEPALLIPLKCINDVRNRDIIAVMSPAKDECAEEMRTWGPAKRKKFREILDRLMLPTIRTIVINRLKQRLSEPLIRRHEVQRACLETALSVAGGDWGCVKTSCIGSGNDVGNVAAECVFHCPRYYDEDAFPEADDAISKVLKAGTSDVVALGNSTSLKERGKKKPHPAKGAFVGVVDPAANGIAESMPKSFKLPPSAFVIQHVDLEYLQEHRKTYESFVDLIGNLYSRKIDTIARHEAYESISLLRYDLKHKNVVNFRDLIEQMVKEVFPTTSVRWALFSWDHEIDDSRTPIASSSNRDGLAMADLVGLNLDQENFSRSLLYFACNSRHPLLVRDVKKDMAPFTVRRRSEHQLNFKAYFEDSVVPPSSESTPTLFVGRRDVAGELLDGREFSALTVPLVSAEGMPVGAIGVATGKSRDLESPTIDSLWDHQNITRIARILYQLRHRSDVAARITNPQGMTPDFT